MGTPIQSDRLESAAICSVCVLLGYYWLALPRLPMLLVFATCTFTIILAHTFVFISIFIKLNSNYLNNIFVEMLKPLSLGPKRLLLTF